ncbi:MAG: hypothetical protein KKB20_08305 [Proteobacteria bacterium]|nr:hypothetical protein [Pseudomonadota bacterium]
MEYIFQESKKEERRFEIRDDGLYYRSTKDGERVLPWDRVRGVHLFSPMKGVYTCRIAGTDGFKAMLANRSFISLDEFNNQDAEYVRFVRGLHHRLAAHPGVRFTGGSTILFWFFALAIPLAVLLIAAAFWVSSVKGRRMPLSPLIGLALVIPLAAVYIKKGKKVVYAPDDIPSRFMPGSDVVVHVTHEGRE